MKEYELRKAILANPHLSTNEKLVLMGLMIRINWESFSGSVSASNVSNSICMNQRSVQRTISSLKKKGAIQRKGILTKINLSFFRGDETVSDETVSDRSVTPKGDGTVTPKGDETVTHTISNNNKQYSNYTVTQEHARDDEEKKDYTFIYPSSIKDPKERLRVENDIKANYHKYTQSDINRRLFPDLTRPNL